MSHSVKVSDQVYTNLLRLQGPRETFSEVIGRMIFIRDTIASIGDTLGPAHYLMRIPEKPQETKEAAHQL